jgi:ribonucleoside-diphosphate reductase alpha chain
MQSAFQRGVDNSISKTINLPNSATYDDVREAYMLAWDLGCLGITIFRDGSKGEQVLNVGVKQESKAETTVATPSAEELAAQAAAEARKRLYNGGVKVRPEVVSGYTRQVRAPEGKVNVTLNCDDDGLLEVFVNVGKAGSDVAALAEGLGRLISLHLRIDSPISQDERAAEVARQLRSIGGSTSIGFGIGRVRSLPDAVARAIELHLARAEDITVAQEAALSEHKPSSANGNGTGHSNGNGGGHAYGANPMLLAPYSLTGNLCTQCGNNTMHYEEGCKKCASCGYSEC